MAAPVSEMAEVGEIAALRARLVEAEAVLDAIRSGAVDAFMGETGGVFHMNGSEKPYLTFFDEMNEGGVTLDRLGKILHCNPRFAAMIGRVVETLRGESFPACVVPENRGCVVDLLANQTAMACEVSLDAPGGALAVRLSLKTVGMGLQAFRCLVVTDMTAAKEAEAAIRRSEERLRAMYANQQTMIEAERKHVAREVHDELGQVLTALRMETNLLQRELVGHDKARERLDEMRLLTEGMFKTVRSIAGSLRPSTLDLGLVSAIEWLAEDFEKRWQIECALDIDPRDIEASDAYATTVFRLIQESLTNVARHANASRVSICLLQSLDRLRLEILDNGCGFVYDQRRISGFGLVGMHERVMELGGTLTVESSPGHGSVFLIDLPWALADKK